MDFMNIIDKNNHFYMDNSEINFPVLIVLLDKF